MENLAIMFFGWLVGNSLLIVLAKMFISSPDNRERKFKSETAQNISDIYESISGDWHIDRTATSGKHTGDLHTFLRRSYGYVGSLLDIVENLEIDK